MKNVLLICLFFISLSSYAQKLADYGFYKVRMTDSDKTILAEIIPIKSNPLPEANLSYYWYNANMIHITQGGFNGNLLNGMYTEYYLNKNLKQQGFFKKGLKNGIWKNWNEEGALLQEYTWDNGMKSGSFSLFDGQGKLIKTGNYSNDKLDGKVYIYISSDSIKVIYYQNGTLLSQKPSFWDKVNVFKRKKQKPAYKSDQSK